MLSLPTWSLRRIALAGCGVMLQGLVAASLPYAGYFDAFYYYHVAINLAEG